MEDFSLPISHLSCEIQNYIHNISEVYQVDPDMVTLVVYTATAVSAGKRVTTFDGTYTNRLALWASLSAFPVLAKLNLRVRCCNLFCKEMQNLSTNTRTLLTNGMGRARNLYHAISACIQ